jgi:hypothetical protein
VALVRTALTAAVTLTLCLEVARILMNYFYHRFEVSKMFFVIRSPLEKVEIDRVLMISQFTWEKWYKDETESNFDDCQFVTNSVEFQSKSTISMKGASAFSCSS